VSGGCARHAAVIWCGKNPEAPMQPVRPLFLVPPAAAVALLAACLPTAGPGPAPTPTGAEDFAAYCVTCHGAEGRGDGPQAAALPVRPADLTTLSARNGGAFPMTRVMAKIWGYTGRDGEVMPQFAPLLDSENLVLFDGGDGILTPTPLRLVQLGQHVQSLQR
jgi:mono/diheme cytochrome c family protein